MKWVTHDLQLEVLLNAVEPDRQIKLMLNLLQGKELCKTYRGPMLSSAYLLLFARESKMVLWATAAIKNRTF